MNSNWSYSPETKSWVVTSVTLTFDLWPWPFAWTLPWSNVITPENFMMIRWWEHSQKGVTDGQTDGQTDRRTENTIHRAAWSQLKMDNTIRKPSYLPQPALVTHLGTDPILATWQLWKCHHGTRYCRKSIWNYRFVNTTTCGSQENVGYPTTTKHIMCSLDYFR